MMMSCATATTKLSDAVDAVTTLIKAYAQYESGRGDTEIDTDATTQWYLKHFSDRKSLSMRYDMSPPSILSNTRDAKNQRLSTLMCPYTNFPYICILDSAIIRSSAVSRTSRSTCTKGNTTKVTAL